MQKLQGCNTAVDSVKGEMEQIYWHERSYLQVKGRLAEDEVLLKARFERQQAEMDRQCS